MRHDVFISCRRGGGEMERLTLELTRDMPRVSLQTLNETAYE